MIDNYNVLEVIDNIDYKIYMYNKLIYKKRVYYETVQLENFLFRMLEIKIKLFSFFLLHIPLLYMNRKNKPLIHFRMNKKIVLAKEWYGRALIINVSPCLCAFNQERIIPFV